MSVEWTIADGIAARAEGWDLFETYEGWQLQSDDESHIFENDNLAARWVVSQAEQGNEPHLKALRFLAQESPVESSLIAESWPNVGVAARHKAFNGQHNQSWTSYPLDHALGVEDGFIVYDGKYYGDWSVSTEKVHGFYRIDVVETANDQVVHSERADLTALEAEQRLGEVWNSRWSSLEAGRYKAALVDDGGGVEYVVQTIEPEWP